MKKRNEDMLATMCLNHKDGVNVTMIEKVVDGKKYNVWVVKTNGLTSEHIDLGRAIEYPFFYQYPIERNKAVTIWEKTMYKIRRMLWCNGYCNQRLDVYPCDGCPSMMKPE